MDRPRLDVEIYQIVDDSMLKQNRSDGTGWDWSWAEWQRDWMDATPHRYAYRCLPLTIMNQTGWWIRNPVGFTATWRGQSQPGTIDFRFDAAPDTWDKWINCQFGEGIITWNTPFLFRTRPAGSRLLDLRSRQLLQGPRPAAYRAHRERLDHDVFHDELENHGGGPADPFRARRAPFSGNPAGEQCLCRS